MLPRALSLTLFTALAAVAASAATRTTTSLTPAQIIRKAVAMQIIDNNKMPAMRFTYTKTTPHGVFVKDVIQTSGGEVSRLVSINGKPLSAARDAQEQQRLKALLSHPADQARHRRHQVADQNRVNRLIQQFPQAFLFTPAGVQPGPYGPMLHFTFAPNPHYSPPDLESAILTSVTGNVWIDQATLHFLKLHAHLMHSVHVGWGIVATFQKGGSVSLTNQNIGRNDWPITRMKLDVDGTALLFKSLHIHITEDQSHFRFLPSGTTWRQAVAILTSKDANSASATNTDTNSPAR
jgi:hypothetical protein